MNDVGMPYVKLKSSVVDEIVLNKGTDDELQCTGYRISLWKNILFCILMIISLGVFYLIIYWRSEWGIWIRYTRSPLNFATAVVLKDTHGQYYVSKVINERCLNFPKEFNRFLITSVEDSAAYGSAQSRFTASQGSIFKFFIHHHVKYAWDKQGSSFVHLRGYDVNTPCLQFLEKFRGLSEKQQDNRLTIFGSNSVIVPVKSYGKLLIEEVLNPFYIFQIFSIILWSSDDYHYFAACIFVISAVSVIVSLYKTRKQSEALHDMISSSSSSTVIVMRKDGETKEIPSVKLVPGDVLIIPSSGCSMVCDAVLVSGTCIVNESMLTGESVPIMKTALSVDEESEVYSPDTHKRHTLFSGTKIIQTRYYGSGKVAAVVVCTGFSTAKGELVRSILFPKPIGFKFYNDSMRFIGLLTCIAVLGMIYGASVFISRGASAGFIIKRVLDIVTIVVPPALPAAMTVGFVYAQARLKKMGIFCISPPRINICGKIKLFCFDKTGTLTEEGLDLWGVLPVHEAKFGHIILDPSDLPEKSYLLASLASCHSLTRIGGELQGDPIDLKMFVSTKWVMIESGHDTAKFDLLTPTIVKPVSKENYIEGNYTMNNLNGISGGDVKVPYEIGIVRQFPFSSSLQMMSVVTRVLGHNHMDLFSKGSPEKIASLCIPETIPANFFERLQEYAIKGFRVIAFSWKPLDPKLTWHQLQRIKRDQIECDMHMLGLLIMQNTLKRETTPVIKKLQDAMIRSVMVTGDNIHTAISVARDCEMVPAGHRIIFVNAYPPEDNSVARIVWEPAQEILRCSNQRSEIFTIDVDVPNTDLKSPYHFATDGRSFSVVRKYFPEEIPKLVVRGTVFARMAPEQKTQLIEILQHQGYIVGMCGDGANDCGALKASHVGISLSEAEASVAAPFTSRRQNIECVLNVIKEGRCSLVTSFGVFKYMALYSIIQFVSVLILYTYGTNLGDRQFLYIDLCITTTMAVFMGYVGPLDTLVSERPLGSLLGPSVLFSIFTQIGFATVFQMAAFFYLTSQNWFVKLVPEHDVKFVLSFETTVIFCVSCYQYLITAIVFSQGKPFRKPFYTNVPLMSSVIILTVFTSVLLLYPGKELATFFQLKHENSNEGFHFRLTLLIFPVLNLLAAILIELFVGTKWLKGITKCFSCKKISKNKYKKIEHELQERNDFPNVGQITYSSHCST